MKSLILAAPQGPGTQALLQQLLLVPLDQLTRALTRGVRAQVHDMWCPAVVQPFAQLASRYPFDPYGPDAALEDVAAFFETHKGQPWQFHADHLKSDVLLRVDHFAFDGQMGGVLKRTYRGELLGYYTRLLAATEALYAGGSTALGADFAQAGALFREVATRSPLAEFLTLPAYERLA